MTFPFARAASAAFLELGAVYAGGQFDFSTSAVLSTLGAEAGDLLILYDAIGSASISLSSGNALTDIGSGFRTRVLNGADLAGTIGGSASGYALLIYRGAASAAVAGSDIAGGAASGRNAGGFTKHAAHAGIVCVVTSTTAAAALSVSAPAAFTTRALFNPSGISTETELLCDRLQPVNPLYVSGTGIVWNASGASNLLRIVELRS